ncbi:MAG: protein kinase [Phycisphaera sp. RhM]|nr:protein kinase [Phycisphaera sp. RhM]
MSVGDRVRYFGDYELLEEIARGGMGVVLKARQINLNRVVALKMILAGDLAGDEEVKRFKSEAESAAQLDHPGIVPIFEIGEHQGQHYFSMGFVDGVSLAVRLRNGPLPPREAAELMAKICEAVSYAHDKGVIHRDLKPGNVLIDTNGAPRVTDFGLAKQVGGDSELTRTGQILGTPAFMPPEQASGKLDEVGPLSDVYSLGAMLNMMLTGRAPFQAASPMETLLQVLDEEPVAPRQLNSAIPIDLETICLKCLEKQPQFRYASAAELHEDMLRFLNDEAIAARRPGTIERLVRWSRKQRTSIKVAVVASSFAIAALLIGMEGKRRLDLYREAYLSVSVAADWTPVTVFEAGSDEEVMRFTAPSEKRVPIPAGSYMIWAEHYGQHWQVDLERKEESKIHLEDVDGRELFQMRDDVDFDSFFRVIPGRREAYFLRENIRSVANRSSPNRQEGGWLPIGLYDGWSDQPLWTINDKPNELDIDFPSMSIPGGAWTADFNGDGERDLALVKGGFYLVVSGRNGRVLFQKPIEGQGLSFGKMMDLTGDGITDLLLKTLGEDLQLLDGKDGSQRWKRSVEPIYIKRTNHNLNFNDTGGAQLTFISHIDKSYAVTFDDGVTTLDATTGDVVMDTSEANRHDSLKLGILSSPQEPLLLCVRPREGRAVPSVYDELAAIGLLSGTWRWRLRLDEYWPELGFERESLIVDDVTSDGTSDVLIALKPTWHGSDPNRLILVNGKSGSIEWEKNIVPPPFFGPDWTVSSHVAALASDSVNRSPSIVCLEYFDPPASPDESMVRNVRIEGIHQDDGHVLWSSSLGSAREDEYPVFLSPTDGSVSNELAIATVTYGHFNSVILADSRDGAIHRVIPESNTRDAASDVPRFKGYRDINYDGLADVVYEQNGRVKYRGGRPTERWCRLGSTLRLGDVDEDGIDDCLLLRSYVDRSSETMVRDISTVVSGASGRKLWTLDIGYDSRDENSVAVDVLGDEQEELVCFDGSDTINVVDSKAGQVVSTINFKRTYSMDGVSTSGVGGRIFFSDLDGDSKQEIVVGFPWAAYQGTGQVALDCKPKSPPRFIIGVVADAEENRDALLDCELLSLDSLSVRLIDGNGAELWNQVLRLRGTSPGHAGGSGFSDSHFEVARVDDDGDNHPEILLKCGTDHWILNLSSGELLSEVLSSTLQEQRRRRRQVHQIDMDEDGRNDTVSIQKEGVVVAVDSNGKSLWKCELPEILDAPIHSTWEFAELRTLNDCLVIQKRHHVVGVELHSGLPRWRSHGPIDASLSTLLRRKENDTPLVVFHVKKSNSVCRKAYRVKPDWKYVVPGFPK